ncbi:MAG: hypothetical protein JWO60_1135 [Frankiales bacterium]|nr:hypothetical protein [Frankiales bacterium]
MCPPTGSGRLAPVPGRSEGSSCAVHASRPAVDACPVCARGRCGPDADAAPGGGCAVCLGSTTRLVVRPAARLELLVRSTLAAFAAAVGGGFVVSEYVGAGLFAYVTPFLLGVLAGEAAQRAAGTTRPDVATRAVAAALAVAGCAVGFRLEGSTGLASGTVLPSYLAALAGAVLWTAPPKRRVRAGRAG